MGLQLMHVTKCTTELTLEATTTRGRFSTKCSFTRFIHYYHLLVSNNESYGFFKNNNKMLNSWLPIQRSRETGCGHDLEVMEGVVRCVCAGNISRLAYPMTDRNW